MDYSSFLRAAEAGHAPPVALLHGPEPFLLQDAVAGVSRALFGENADVSLCREILEAREAGAEGILQAALVLPWMAERRLVVARGVQTLGAKQGESLAGYVRSPNPSTVLLLLADDTLEPSHWLLRAMPAAAVVAVPPLAGRALVAWLLGRARLEGLEVDEDAAALLVEMAGDDPGQLLGEVAKAAVHGGPQNRRVSLDEVRAVVGEHRVRHVFDLTRALVRSDRSAALGLLDSLLGAGEEPLALLGLLAREVRTWWQAAEGLHRGRPEEEIVRGLRRPPAVAAAVVERARRLSPAVAAGRLQRCWEAERRLKLGAPARSELSLLVWDLCAG